MSRELSEDVDADALRTDLEEIKGAMGLASEHPYWWRFWIVEGICTGIVFAVVQFWLREGFRPWIAVAFAGVIAGCELAKRRVRSNYRPPTGVPDQRRWGLAVFAGTGVLLVGLRPVFESLDATNAVRLALVSAGAVVGVGYVLMGQLLAAYDIRAVDRYAFIGGGAWIMALSAAIPYVPLLEGWEYAALGAGIALHHSGTYAVLSRY
ncbi:hypothetical protein [Natrinema versiforme]|uniref:Uncharacterized protein n=1 Tax=Natrinema versiforme TaxID=88724 RepID=A0A4V1FY71_9EURY|nr:hypothetical protein [Natrinema versiforme]QCS41222.1 hypothetical protein FEJ81_02230 [Natrinema versiforme]